MGKCRDENKEIVLQKTDHHFGTAVFGDAVQIIGVGFPNTSNSSYSRALRSRRFGTLADYRLLCQDKTLERINANSRGKYRRSVGRYYWVVLQVVDMDYPPDEYPGGLTKNDIEYSDF